MASLADQTTARVIDREEGGVMDISLAGVWRITEQRPLWADLVKSRRPSNVRVRMDEVERWDSSLLLYAFEVQQWCRATGVNCDLTALPEKVRTLMAQISASHESSVPFDR